MIDELRKNEFHATNTSDSQQFILWRKGQINFSQSFGRKD